MSSQPPGEGEVCVPGDTVAGLLRHEGFSLEPFTQDELWELHRASAQVLETIGIRVHSTAALELFAEAGAKLERQERLVRIPEWMVWEAVTSAPRQVLFAARTPELDVVVGGRRVLFSNFGGAVLVEDPFTCEIRKSTTRDVFQTAVLCDALDQVDIYSSAVVAQDVPQETQDLHEAVAFLAGTRKHCQHANLLNGEHVRRLAEMAAFVAGGRQKLRERPIVSVLVCPVSPLELGKEGCEIIMEAARSGLPVTIMSMAYAGLSAPVTLAGAMVVHNAEVLAGIVLHQLTCKGAPVIYGSSTTTFDLGRAMTPAAGAPELAMLSAAAAQVARFYGLPSYVAGG